MPAKATTPKHTPWVLWNGYGPLPNGKYAVARIGPTNGGMFSGLVGTEGHDIIGSKNDLELVVQAVNSHDALLEAAKAMPISRCQCPGRLGHTETCPTLLAWENLQAAIAAVAGRIP